MLNKKRGPRLFITMVAVGSIVSTTAIAQSSRQVAFWNLVDSEAPEPFINGSVLVAENGSIVFRADRGFADFKTRERIGPSSVFQTASASKPFTAIAILQLRDAGRLRLDDPVVRHLPGFPDAGITLRHLLTHTSGLPDLQLFEGLAAQAPDHVVSGADLVPALRAWTKPLPSQPGAAFSYANVNFQLLAEVVARVSRTPFGIYVREQIFRPAGMRSSYVLGTPPISSEGLRPVKNNQRISMFDVEPEDVATASIPDPRKARRYRYETFNIGRTVGDQNVFTTLDDLRRFDQALRRNRILSASSQAESYTPVRLNDGSTYRDAEEYQIYGVRCSYGLGWEVCDHPRYGRLVGHAGYNPGITTQLYRNLTRGQLIAMFDNSETPDFAQRFAAIAAVLNGDLAPKIDRRLSLDRAYGDLLVREGPTEALRFFLDKRTDTDRWWNSRGGMNMLGYDLLRSGRPALAVEAFRLNVINHPTIAGIWDSLGDGLDGAGQRKDARAAYERSLELDPQADGTRRKLQALNDGGPGSQ